MNLQRVSRWIRGYDKSDGKLVSEHQLPESLTLERLHALCRVSSEDPMFDCFPIGDLVMVEIERAVGMSLRVDNCDFFVEANAE